MGAGVIDMFYRDLMYLQSPTEVNVNGSVSRSWNVSDYVYVDAQPMPKEKVAKEYGFTDADEWLKVFAPVGSGFVSGDQCSYDGQQWLIRLVESWGKIGRSNHDLVILSKVV